MLDTFQFCGVAILQATQMPKKIACIRVFPLPAQPLQKNATSQELLTDRVASLFALYGSSDNLVRLVSPFFSDTIE